MTVLYPWKNLKPGEGFFVPGLDLVAIRMAGLKSALPYRYKVDATFGIKDGLIGVRFSRPPRAHSPPA